ncbi:Receptor tyrosine-protein kinase erbB-4 [Rhizoctonia solani]|uniref:Receptor tyrosine-protein kinase erbB-4 n=1 Tax=Rhizoctonia solani TaxID=456999 RepID=A0A0K6G9S6_9AGAM|nr:Receptor tyrosine-protein kinase erbB-4 [Rhizoctonia solani]
MKHRYSGRSILAEKRKIDASSIRHANCSYFTTPEGVLPRKGIGGNYSTRLSKSVDQIDSGSGTTFEVAYGRRTVLDGNETGIRELVEPVDAPEFSTLEVDSREIDDRFNQDITTPSTRHTITGAMSTTEILEYLVAHGCRKISEDFDISHVSKYPVSSGGFGDVYCATLRNGNRVGLKCMRVLVGSANEGRKFLKHAAHELYVWSKRKHPSILELSGVTLFLDRCDLCVQIADGVKYLHEQSIVHGDLKLENILIAKDYAPKLTDFGNAMLTEYISLQFTATTTWQSISLRWTAPEIIKGETKSTREGDIYALGMVIFKTITQTVPYSEAKDSTIMFRTLSGKTPSRPEPHIPTGIEQADHLWSIITGCWASDPTERPSAEEVRNMMARITPGGLLADIDQANQ